MFNFLKKQKPDILIVCDTRIAKNIEHIVKAEWGGPAYFSSFDSQSRGVAMFIKKDLPIKILDEFSDKNGNLLGILIEYDAKKILLEGIYGPNTDSPDFFESEVFEKLQDWNPHHAIFTGDWNLILDKNLDTLNYQSIGNPRAQNTLISKINEHKLIDIYRELNPTERKFSWKQWGSHKYGRLDYFLISSSLLPYIKNANISPGSYSDHYPITLDIDFSKFQRGKGFWKFNNSLLTDPSYSDLIKNTIKTTACQYSVVNDDQFYVQNLSNADYQHFLDIQTPESLQSLILSINDELFLDTLLMEIRRATINYSSKTKRDRLAKQQLLMHDIEILEILSQNQVIPDKDITDELNQKKEALEKNFDYEAEGAFIRSRCNYRIHGEKPTKLFCSLESRNRVQKYVSQLITIKNDTENILTEQKDIEMEIYDFYKNLFDCKDDQIDGGSIEDFLGQGGCNSLPKLTASQKNSMKGTLTLQEMTSYLKKTKNNVSPGSSGFTNEFFKFFWRDIKYFVLKSAEYSFKNNRLSASKSLGIISIIPKGEKDKRFLSNWRPLTLLDTLYKLISGCIAERIKPALDTLVHPDQKGFVAGRYIGEVVRTTTDIIEYAKENNASGLLLLIDFEKAYDSISFKYIIKCLKILDFCDDMIKWVGILLNNFKAVVNHCGNSSKSFNIGRGCRQGDPIASYLFIICVEILAHRLRTNRNIESFTHNNLSHLLEIYADDLSIFLHPSSVNLRNTILTLDAFYHLSGLKISVSKTKAIWFGSASNSNQKLCPELELKWVKTFELLGINFDNNLANMNSNFEDKILKIEKLLAHWSYRYLTPFGKVTVIKSLALSKLSHIAMVVPNPSKMMFKRLEGILYKFLWGGKSEKVSRVDTKLPEKMGGLGMPDIEEFWLALKYSWLRRLLTTKSFWPNILLKQISIISGQEISIGKLLQLGPSLLGKIGKSMKNKFWEQVLRSTIKMSEGMTFCSPENLLYSSFWYNPSIRRNNKVISYDVYPEIRTKVTYLADFFNTGSNTLMDYETFKIHHNVEISEMKYIDIRYVIKLALQKLNFPVMKLPFVFYPLAPILISIALSTKKGCGTYCKILSKKRCLHNKLGQRDEKWHQELQELHSVTFWDKIRHLNSTVNFDNNIKWLQFQIIRNCLQTNFIVSHFIPNVSPLCKYCGLSNEKISHLYWLCPNVHSFLEDTFNYINSTGLEYNPTKIEFLFGVPSLSSEHPKNYLSLLIKKFIWKTKFKTDFLSIVGLKTYLKLWLKELKFVYEIKEEALKFNEWIMLYNDLYQEPEDAVHLVPSQPSPV